MIKNISKIIVIFVFGIFGGIFADQILWPYFIERPLFYKYRLEQAPIYINQTEQVFIEESNALESAVEKVEKSIVGIRIKLDNGKNLEGSGVIITSDGLIVTLLDLVSQKGSAVVFYDGQVGDYKIIKRDTINNLALIKIEEKNLATVSFSEFGSLRFGQKVFLIGAYFKEGKFSKIVNAGVIKTYDENNIETNIVEENNVKGSAIFNIKGELIGINDVGLKNKLLPIPADKIREFIGF